MKARAFGQVGCEVTTIGQGTWQVPETGKARSEAIASIRRGIELGMTHIDTAEMYGSGESERIVGEAVRGVDRDKLFIVSKVLPSNASYTKTIDRCERSLKNLNIDYLDCYLLHWRGSIELSETLAAFEKLQRDGKIRSFGVSNFDVEDLEEAIECLTEGRIACNQVLYNLSTRGIERRLIPFCQKNEIALVGYTPFGTVPTPQVNAANHKVIQEIAESRDATIRQVILSFLTRMEGTFTIPKASKIAHVEENAAAISLSLSEEEIQLIDSVYPAPNKDVPLQML